MISEDRVKLMTKLAIYENTDGKEELNITKYYERDYVRFNMFRTAVSATLAFVLIAIAYVMLNMEEIMVKLNDLDFVNLAKSVGIIFLIYIVVYMVIAWVVYARKYEKSKPNVLQYNHRLKQLKDLYDKEEKELNDKLTGRSVTFSNDNISNN